MVKDVNKAPADALSEKPEDKEVRRCTKVEKHQETHLLHGGLLKTQGSVKSSQPSQHEVTEPTMEMAVHTKRYSPAADTAASTNHRPRVQPAFAPSFLQSTLEGTPSSKLSHQDLPQPEKYGVREL